MNSIAKIVHSLQSAAQLAQLSTPSDQAVKGIIGASLTEAAGMLFPGIQSKQTEELIKHYKHQYLTVNKTASPLYDHVPRLLNGLANNNKLLAVATGKGRQGLDRVLIETQTDQFFHTTRSCDDAKSKPSPEMLLQILDELKIKPEQALMIGDSHYDLLMAQNANVDSIGITHGVGDAKMLTQYSPRALVDSINDLEKIIL